jgi:hypothetical protein
MASSSKRARGEASGGGDDALSMSPDERMQWWLGGAKEDDPSNANLLEGGSSRMCGDSLTVADHAERSELAFIAGLLSDPTAPDASDPSAALDGEPSSPQPKVTVSDVTALLSSLPNQYALSTSRADQEMHARLLRQLRDDGRPVLTKWVRSKTAKGDVMLQLHIVFRDRSRPSPHPS